MLCLLEESSGQRVYWLKGLLMRFGSGQESQGFQVRPPGGAREEGNEPAGRG